MELNERLRAMKTAGAVCPREEKIWETVAASRDFYFRQEQLMPCWEFLWNQLRFTRKRWWTFQGLLLALACRILPEIKGEIYQARSVGVIGCLFVVLIVPELWRNKKWDSVQVEAACLYSLRQVYAARITLFGLADVFFLTAFGAALGNMGFSIVEVVSQFLLPMTVTACICFSLLCGKQNWGETPALAACLVWCGIWWLIVMDQGIFFRIVPAVWMILFGAALGFLLFVIRRTVRTANQYWEVGYCATAID